MQWRNTSKQQVLKECGVNGVKPENIINNLIINSSVEGGVILDTFSGSGTTCYCAKKLNRQYLGFEIDKDFYEISIKRLNNEDANGQTYLDI